MAVTATILSDGTAMDPTYQVASLGVVKAVNRVPSAEIRLLDGSGPEQRFAISDTAFFEPGAEVEIKLRYEGDDDHTVFTGVVIRHGVEAGHQESLLAVHLKDPAVKLTHVRRSAVFAEQSDADAIGAIADAAGLAATVPATKPTHEELVQYHSTDWDFIVSRAEANGLLVVAEGGELTLAPADAGGGEQHTIEFGLDVVYGFEMEFDGRFQPEGYESVAWDPAAQAMTTPAPAAAFSYSLGNLKAEDVAKKVGFGTYLLSHPVPVDPDELQAWADARMAKSRLAMVRGRLSLPGTGNVALLDDLEIGGVGDRFNGSTVVTGLAHRLSPAGWITDIQFGVSPDLFSSEPDVASPPAAGLLPPARGLQVGVVADFEEDPSGEIRVRVIVPGIDPDAGVLWARLAAPDAGAGRGWVFRPEVGDEVVVGFLNDDPRRPVILGSLFSSSNPAPDDLSSIDGDNFLKGIVTRSGTKLIFDDDKAAVTVETPAGNGIVLDDDAATITLTDQHGSTVTMSEDGVAVSSAKVLTLESTEDMEITAGGALKLSAGADLAAEASGNVEIKGAKVDVK